MSTKIIFPTGEPCFDPTIEEIKEGVWFLYSTGLGKNLGFKPSGQPVRGPLTFVFISTGGAWSATYHIRETKPFSRVTYLAGVDIVVKNEV